MIKLIDIYEEIIKGTDIEIDNRHGVGAVPNNLDVNYLGFETEMTPDEFLSLATPTDMEFKNVKNMWDLLQSRGMGTPFLNVRWKGDFWQVEGHEGRHRMEAIKRYGNPNAKIPVHIFPMGGMRARDITTNMKHAKFNSQRDL